MSEASQDVAIFERERGGQRDVRNSPVEVVAEGEREGSASRGYRLVKQSRRRWWCKGMSSDGLRSGEASWMGVSCLAMEQQRAQ